VDQPDCERTQDEKNPIEAGETPDQDGRGHARAATDFDYFLFFQADVAITPRRNLRACYAPRAQLVSTPRSAKLERVCDMVDAQPVPGCEYADNIEAYVVEVWFAFGEVPFGQGADGGLFARRYGF